MNALAQHPITPREQLDFKLDASIPKYWFNQDAFKTRFLDAVSVTFPEGERYFMTCMRQFRDQITDENLREDVMSFNRQEAQHGIVHTTFNNLLKDQGLPVAELNAEQRRRLNAAVQRLPASFNLAIKEACEHITALMAEIFFADPDFLKHADYRVRAMLAWHAMEEMEHKAVAFDTMQKVAQVGYIERSLAMLFLTSIFVYLRIKDTNVFLRADGFSKTERVTMLVKNLPWLFGKKGIVRVMTTPWLEYFKPGFHPWQQVALPQYQVWLAHYIKTGDPIAASEVLFAK